MLYGRRVGLCWRPGGFGGGAGRCAGVLTLALLAAVLDLSAAVRSGHAATGSCTLVAQKLLGHCSGSQGRGPATRIAGTGAPLRLKGGRGCTGTRNSVKQRKVHIPAGVQKNARRNRPIFLSHKPCSGPKALSKIERMHGAGVVQQVRGGRYSLFLPGLLARRRLTSLRALCRRFGSHRPCPHFMILVQSRSGTACGGIGSKLTRASKWCTRTSTTAFSRRAFEACAIWSPVS